MAKTPLVHPSRSKGQPSRSGFTQARSVRPSRSGTSGRSLVQPSRTGTQQSLSGSSQDESTQLGEQEISNTETSKRKRNVRGRTRGLGLAKKRRSGEKLTVKIPKILNRIVGVDAQDLITEIGCIARQYAPLKVDRWDKIEQLDRDKMLALLKDKFTIPSEKHVLEAIDFQFRTAYKGYRHRLHKHLRNCSTLQEARQSVPTHLGVISQEDWNLLVNYFISDAFQAVSERNKRNRGQQKIKHIIGTKSISRISWEMRDPETEELPGIRKLWTVGHFSEARGEWANEDARKVIEEVDKLASQEQEGSTEEGSTIRTDEERFRIVLGEKPGYIRGLGAGPKPISSKRAYVALEKRAEELETELQSLKANMQSEMHNQVQAEVKVHVAVLQSQVQSQVQEQVQAQMASFFGQLKQAHNVFSGVAGLQFSS